MLYLQNLVNEKLHKELRLRNLIAHVALSKRLHEMQMEYDVEDYVPAGKKSESFTEFLTHTHPRTNTSSSMASMSGLCEQYGAMTLCDHKNNKEIS
jgi:hypothetical protein